MQADVQKQRREVVRTCLDRPDIPTRLEGFLLVAKYEGGGIKSYEFADLLQREALSSALE